MYSHSRSLNPQEEEKDKLRCFHTEVLTENQSMDKLPKDAVIIQFMEASNDTPAPVLAATDIAELHLEAQVHLHEKHCIFYKGGCRLHKRCTDAVLDHENVSGLSPAQWLRQACLFIVNGSPHLQLLMSVAWLP